MTAEGFAQSSLSMVNDLRFGAALQRIQQLGCDEEEVQAAVVGEVCESIVPDESAKAVILNKPVEAEHEPLPNNSRDPRNRGAN